MFDFFVDIIFDGNLIIASAVAMFAGLVSFASPCVIPLVPGYLAYAAGMTEVRSRGRAALGSVALRTGFLYALYCLWCAIWLTWLTYFK